MVKENSLFHFTWKRPSGNGRKQANHLTSKVSFGMECVPCRRRSSKRELLCTVFRERFWIEDHTDHLVSSVGKSLRLLIWMSWVRVPYHSKRKTCLTAALGLLTGSSGCQCLKIPPGFGLDCLRTVEPLRATLNDALQCVAEPKADVKTKERSGQPAE